MVDSAKAKQSMHAAAAGFCLSGPCRRSTSCSRQRGERSASRSLRAGTRNDSKNTHNP